MMSETWSRATDQHVRSGWRHRRNLWTGIAVLTTMGILAISALVLYYGGEDIRVSAK